MQCWKSCCQNEVKVFCECNKPALFSCSSHFIEHIDLDADNSHLPSTLLRKPINETKIGLIHEIEKSSAELMKFKDDLVEKVSNKIQILQNLLSKALKIVDELNSNQRMLINKLDSIEYVSRINPNPYEELLYLPIEKALVKLNKFAYSTKHLNFSIRDILAANSDIELTIGNPNEIYSNEIIFFKHQTKNILKVNLQNLKPSEIPLPLEDEGANSFGMYCTAISMCQIPNLGIFCYGNHPGTGTAFILTPDCSIKKLSNGFRSGNMSAALYEDIIYLFGGWDSEGQPWNKAFKYSLLDNNWQEICYLKEDISFITNIVTNEGILLAGYQSKNLYRYDIEYDEYFELASFTKYTFKILCSRFNRKFLLESTGNIYENDPKCLRNWISVGKFEPDLFSSPIPFLTFYNDSIYFLCESKDLYKFSMEELSLKKILIAFQP